MFDIKHILCLTALITLVELKSFSSTCADLKCNNGYCKQTTEQEAICICDEGFLGTNCNQQGPDFYQRTELLLDLADPNVLAINDDLFVLMGTADTRVLPIYQSTDLITFQLNNTYNPSAVDPTYDYCSLWAPNLVKNASNLTLHFVGQRVSKGAACPASGEQETTFVATSPGYNFMFGIPELVDFGPGAPKGRITTGCNDDGCPKTVRIDPDVISSDDGLWFFYVWYQGGNSIASFPWANPTNVTYNTGPAIAPTPPAEENVNEAPEVFEHNGNYYLFFSTAGYNSQYAMKYIMSNNIDDITRKRAVRINSIPVRSSAGNLVQTHGSNSIVKRRGQLFNVFHQGVFDSAGRFMGRSTFKKRLAFKPDGSLQNLNTVEIRWTRIPSYVYSLDIVLNNGTAISHCISANRIKDAPGVVYNGICLDYYDQLIDKSEISTFRLYYSNDGTWTHYVDEHYDTISDQLAISLPGGITDQIVIQWNERVTGTQYSLDVRRSDGSWIAPCVPSGIIGNSIEYVFDGNCQSSGLTVSPSDITSIRVCSAINGDWSHAVCGTVSYDGRALIVYVTI